MNRLLKHPCFNVDAKNKYGRVHLPVAPHCNMQCNYCNRKFDCVNESRPGVTSAVLSPLQAMEYLNIVMSKNNMISVAGIAGPGDPFANPEETMETLRLIREKYPEIILCLATNGLNILSYIDELSELEVSHVTITVNAVDPEIGAKIYSFISCDNKVYKGIKAAEILLTTQLEAIKKLKEKGITVKINSIILPGINDFHIAEIAKKAAELGADIMNCVPVCPVENTVFEDIKEPSKELVSRIRFDSSLNIKQMRHCARCRADAVGLLGKDDPEALKALKECSKKCFIVEEKQPCASVSAYDNVLIVNLNNMVLNKKEAPEIVKGDLDKIYKETSVKIADIIEN